MSSSATAAAAAGTRPPDAGSAGEVRRAWRDLRAPVLGGVAAGLAEHLAVPVLRVRVAFAVGALLGGAGVAAYGALWVLLPAGPPPSLLAPGVESAARTGRAPGGRGRGGIHGVGSVVALAALGLGVLGVVDVVFGSGFWVWPLAIAVVGVALLWRQADEAQRQRWVDATGRVDPVRVVLGTGGWAAWVRLGAGVGLVGVALLLVTLRQESVAFTGDTVLVLLLGVGGLAIVLGPLVYRLLAELADERAERIRTQERADVAAHLHDSVLQTLALIQKNPADAVRLARAQERDLRAWLYAGESLDDATVASALRAAMAEVEDAYGVGVDVVTVGDRASDEHTRALVAAAREAATNAAKHAQVGRVDVFAEIGAEAVEVYVRDRGVGFDPAATPQDRLGVRHSIVDRIERHGGRAEVRSVVGEGTEVRLVLERPAGARDAEPASSSAQPGERMGP